MPFRKLLFWAHLAAGLAIGCVILSMALSGLLLAFEPQITDWSEKRVRWVDAPAGDARRVGLDAMLAAARAEIPGPAPMEVKLWSDPLASVSINLGKDKGSVYVNPYSGQVMGRDSRAYFFLRQVEEWHRWLASKKIWKPVIDAVSLAFVFMILSGLFLWWPRRWTQAALRAIAVPKTGLSGKARDWNWHNAVGLWSAPLLLVIALTGTVIGYRWANDLLFVLTGNTPPPKPVEAKRASQGPIPMNLEALMAAAQNQIQPRETDGTRPGKEGPGWASISLRLPQKADAPALALIQAPGLWGQYTRSQLTLSAVSAEVLKWEPYSGYNLGRKLRGWMVPIHTGRAGGLPGQILAAAAACAALVLVWTGLALSWRRFFKAKPREAP